MHECKNVKEINMVISPGFEPYFYHFQQEDHHLYRWWRMSRRNEITGYSGCPENICAEMHLGFESLFLRQRTVSSKEEAIGL